MKVKISCYVKKTANSFFLGACLLEIWSETGDKANRVEHGTASTGLQTALNQIV